MVDLLVPKLHNRMRFLWSAKGSEEYKTYDDILNDPKAPWAPPILPLENSRFVKWLKNMQPAFAAHLGGLLMGCMMCSSIVPLLYSSSLQPACSGLMLAEHSLQDFHPNQPSQLCLHPGRPHRIASTGEDTGPGPPGFAPELPGLPAAASWPA